MTKHDLQVAEWALAEWLAHVVEASGSRAVVARMAGGLTPAAVGYWLSGQRSPTAASLLLLAHYSQIPLPSLAAAQELYGKTDGDGRQLELFERSRA